MVKLNKEELLVGFIYGSATWPLIGWIAVFPGIVCAFLWAIGGAGPKLVRRIGVPVVVGISLCFTNLWLLLTIPPLWGIVALGYGMPDATDKGSWLGRLYLKFLPYQAANWATRLTIFVLFDVVIIAALAILKIR
jgi:hypothetical protein